MSADKDTEAPADDQSIQSVVEFLEILTDERLAISEQLAEAEVERKRVISDLRTPQREVTVQVAVSDKVIATLQKKLDDLESQVEVWEARRQAHVLKAKAAKQNHLRENWNTQQLSIFDLATEYMAHLAAMVELREQLIAENNRGFGQSQHFDRIRNARGDWQRNPAFLPRAISRVPDINEAAIRITIHEPDIFESWSDPAATERSGSNES